LGTFAGDPTAVPETEALPLMSSSPRSEEPTGRQSRGSGSPAPVSGLAGGHRADIEGLRGVAILLVVLYHAGVPGIGGGYVGVDVFFVLSGFLITALLVGEVERTGSLDLWHFYARRVRRLLPAAAVVLVATMAAGALVFSPLEQMRLARSALAAATYLSNVWFAFTAGDYFAPAAATDPLLHTWSLAVEEQFYLVWPILILLALRGSGTRRRVMVALGVVAVTSLTASIWLTASGSPWAFFGSPTRAWEFALGGMAGLVPTALAGDRWGRTRGVLAFAGLWMIGGSAVLYGADTPFPGVAAVVPVVGTVAVLLSGTAGSATVAARFLGSGPLTFLGRHSYSWYLWHWPVLVIAIAVHPSITLSGRLLCILFALGLSAVTYATVENPVRFHPRLVPKPVLSLALGVLLTASAGAGALGWRQLAVSAANHPLQVMFTAAAMDRDLGPCIAEWGVDRAVGCEFGDPDSEMVIALFGDSHAAHWFPAFRGMAEEQGWRLVVLTKAACPSASLPFADPRLRDAGECDRWRANALERLKEIQPSLAVLGNAKGFYPGLVYRDWRRGYDLTLGRLDDAGIQSVVLKGTPVLDRSLPECLSRAVRLRRDPAEACGVDRRQALDPPAFQAAADAARAWRGASLGDLSHLFCDEDRCHPLRGGNVVLHDRSHLTATSAAALAPEITALVLSLIGGSEPEPR
jgi:peptidoglycan/LPS O-acetylase OafA/YrhL